MKIKEVMSTDVLTVAPALPLKDVARLLVRHGISGAPVVDEEGAVLGVVSEGDLLFKERGRSERKGILSWLLDEYGMEGQAKLEARTAAEAMSSPARTIEPWRSVASAAAQMLEQHVNRLPVVEQGALVGIVTRADLVRAFVRADNEIELELRQLLQRLFLHDVTGVRIDVNDGDVVLAGELERRSDAEIVTRNAELVPGVVSVDSRVTWREDRL